MAKKKTRTIEQIQERWLRKEKKMLQEGYKYDYHAGMWRPDFRLAIWKKNKNKAAFWIN